MLRRDPLAHPERLIRRVYSYVAYRLGDGPEAEDVTSEVFERALRYRHTYDPSKGKPVAWLLGIARRSVDTALAARPAAAHDDVPDRAGPEDVEDRAVRRLTLAAAVACLEPRDRELVALRYGADLTAGQIAELLDLRVNTVEVALHRSLARLRALLDAPEPAPAARGSASIEARPAVAREST